MTLGYLYALIAALLFGANGSLTKLLIEAGLTPLQLTQFRTLGTAVIAAACLLVIDRRAFRLTWRQLGVMAILGIAGVALLQASYAAALQRLPVGITLLLEYMAVLLVAVIAFFFLKEQVKARLWVAIGLVLAGLAVVARVWDSHLDPIGVAFALVAAATLALYFLVGERQVGQTSPLVVAFYTTGFAALFWSFFSGWWNLTAGTFQTPVPLGGVVGDLELPLWIPLVVTIVVGSFLPFVFSFFALKHLSATAAGIVASSEVIFAFGVAWIWLGEGLDAIQLAGAAVVLVGIILAQTARSGKVVDADLALATGPIPTSDRVGGQK